MFISHLFQLVNNNKFKFFLNSNLNFQALNYFFYVTKIRFRNSSVRKHEVSGKKSSVFKILTTIKCSLNWSPNEDLQQFQRQVKLILLKRMLCDSSNLRMALVAIHFKICLGNFINYFFSNVYLWSKLISFRTSGIWIEKLKYYFPTFTITALLKSN